MGRNDLESGAKRPRMWGETTMERNDRLPFIRIKICVVSRSSKVEIHLLKYKQCINIVTLVKKVFKNTNLKSLAFSTCIQPSSGKVKQKRCNKRFINFEFGSQLFNIFNNKHFYLILIYIFCPKS